MKLLDRTFLCLLLLSASTAANQDADRMILLDRAGHKARLTPKSTGNLPTPQASQVLTIITPSPSASLVTITAQSQLVKSYIPTLTYCHLGAKPFPIASASGLMADTSNGTTAAKNPGPALNCTTLYSTTVTPICHTTLHPVGAGPITVTDCSKSVTFSTDHALQSYSDEPSEQCTLMTTNYIANWAQLTTDGLPQGTITADICSSNGCSRHLEQWHAAPVKTSDLTTYTIQYHSTVIGPAVVEWGSRTVSVAPLSTVGFNISETSVLTHYYESQTAIFSTIGIVPPPTLSPTPSATPTAATSSKAATTTVTSTSTSFTTVMFTTT